MGGGIIIQQNAAVMKAVKDPSVYRQLPVACQTCVDAICAKGIGGWIETDYAYMVSMLFVGRHARWTSAPFSPCSLDSACSSGFSSASWLRMSAGVAGGGRSSWKSTARCAPRSA